MKKAAPALTERQVTHILYPNDGPETSYVDPGPVRGRRYTQDTPILPEVWIAYGKDPETAEKHGILLTPNAESSIGELVRKLRRALARRRGKPEKSIFLAYNESHVVAHVNLEELICCVLPLSVWWKNNLKGMDVQASFKALLEQDDLKSLLLKPASQLPGVSPDVLDMIRITSAVALGEPLKATNAYFKKAVGKLAGLFAKWEPPVGEDEVAPLWSVFVCRMVESAVCKSRVSVKADAAIRVFELSCKDLVWAVIDSGIDSEQHAFHEWPATDPHVAGDKKKAAKFTSRVMRTYDFTRINWVLEAAFNAELMNKLKELDSDMTPEEEEQLENVAKDLGARLLSGQTLDWGLLEPFLRVRKGKDGKIPAPANEHGTHVAGILAADWRKLNGRQEPYKGYEEPPEESITGVCPDLKLYDLRVIEANGSGSEFAVLSALQFVRNLNQNRDKMVIHGVNLSFSLPQQVKSFACGSSPVCSESERLMNSGVVVVAAAGNRGYIVAQDGFEWYRDLSITDPGNSDAVITVGATHRTEPHRYGVSYFSSRGPTGDGRMKPDLVAPGEKIESVVPGGSVVALDGTSMAAPHVSGAAALLMARHRELMGRPRKIKEVLCATATDLGRERSFQGAGMLDVLRALQAV